LGDHGEADPSIDQAHCSSIHQRNLFMVLLLRISSLFKQNKNSEQVSNVSSELRCSSCDMKTSFSCTLGKTAGNVQLAANIRMFVYSLTLDPAEASTDAEFGSLPAV